MEYVTLAKHSRDHMIVMHYMSTEASVHSHALNVERYERMLMTGGLSPDTFKRDEEGKQVRVKGFETRIKELLATERAALAENLAIAVATAPQLSEPHIVRAIMAAHTAEIAAQSPAPAERAAAISASDRAWAESIPTIAFLKSTLKSTG